MIPKTNSSLRLRLLTHTWFDLSLRRTLTLDKAGIIKIRLSEVSENGRVWTSKILSSLKQ